jgi:hypothetical protein
VTRGSLEPFAQAIDGGRLISLRFEAGYELEAPVCAHLSNRSYSRNAA